MNKQIEQVQDAELITSLNGHPFVIQGPVEAVTELYEAAQADFNAQPAKDTTHVAKRAVVGALEATELYTEPSKRERIAQYFADAKLRRFDKVWNTDLYAEKQAQRRKTAIFLMASEAELFDRGSDYYKSQLNRLTKSR